jgi:hypothetical protein
VIYRFKFAVFFAIIYTLSITFSYGETIYWEKIKDAKSYRFQLANDLNFSKILIDQEQPINSIELPLPPQRNILMYK